MKPTIKDNQIEDAGKLTEKGLSRRNFIIAGVAAGGGLLLSFALPKRLDANGIGVSSTPAEVFEPNAFIRINNQGEVFLVMSKAEMGQAIFTSLTMLLAEELEVDPQAVKLVQAPANNELYADPILGAQVTGASTSIRGAWEPMRKAGATARTMLINSAALEWKINPNDCIAKNGKIFKSGSNESFTYGELASRAATLPVPNDIRLKDPKDFTLVGTNVKRVDSPDKVNGKIQYGIDVQLPNMKIATVAMCPVIGGKVKSVQDSKALAVSGVRKVVKLESAIVVIADHMWAAKLGIAALDIQWDEGEFARNNMQNITDGLAKASLGNGDYSVATATNVGDFKSAFKKAPIKHEAIYQMPFLSHSAIEPLNATVHCQKDRCDIWVGTQVPAKAQSNAAKITNLPVENIFVHNHHIGGGFGRRLDVDFINQAVKVAMHVDYPVKLIWTRETDMQHGIYRPYYYDRLAAGLDKNGDIIAWNHRVTGSSIIARFAPAKFKNGLDADAVEVAKEPLYAHENVLVEYSRHETLGIATGWWRGVGATHNTFMAESFIDELAHLAGKDPLQYRLSKLGKSPRSKHVLEVAAKKAGWGDALPKGTGRGLSVQFAFGSYVAQIADVEVKGNEVNVKRVVCVVDCGTVINPNHVIAQMEGGIVFGLSAVLWGEITFNDGKVEQSNFNDYRVVRMNEAPRIEVHIVQSGEAPGGIGEPGTAALAPAITNAIFAATGKRIRKLPIASSFDDVS